MHLSILYQVPITPIKHSYFATLPCFTPSFSAVCPLFNGSFYVVFCIAYALFFFQTLIKANKKGVSALFLPCPIYAFKSGVSSSPDMFKPICKPYENALTPTLCLKSVKSSVNSVKSFSFGFILSTTS